MSYIRAKQEYYQAINFTTDDYRKYALNDERERIHLKEFALAHQISAVAGKESELWGQVAGETSVGSRRYINDNKQAFYTSPVPRMYHATRNLPGLIAYYPLNEKTGTVATNRAPSTVGTLNGTISGATLNQSGLFGRAFVFDGVNDTLESVDASPLYGNTAFTMMMLVRNTNIAQNNVYLYAEGSSASNTPLYGLNFNAAGTNIVFFVRDDANATLESSSTSFTVTENEWFLLTLVDNNGTVSIYKNAVASTTNHNYTRGALTLDRQTFMFLGRTGNAQFAKGDLQHVALFNQALTSSQITQIARVAGLA